MNMKLAFLACFILYISDVISDSSSEAKDPDVSNHKNLGLLPKDCGPIAESKKILNGKEAGLFQTPWMALLSFNSSTGQRFACAGTVINDRYILTVAHCLNQRSSPIVSVRVGEYDVRTNPDCEEEKKTCAPPVQDVGVERVIAHPNYKASKFENDIGLVRLDSQLKFSDSLAPICLPVTQASANFNNAVLEVPYFGLLRKGRNITTLERNEFTLVGQTECKNNYEKKSIVITDSHLCAQLKSKDNLCASDSGAPLQVTMSLHGKTRAVQQGLSSFGPRGCGAEDMPDVFTKVPHYMNWILENISA